MVMEQVLAMIFVAILGVRPQKSALVKSTENNVEMATKTNFSTQAAALLENGTSASDELAPTAENDRNNGMETADGLSNETVQSEEGKADALLGHVKSTINENSTEKMLSTKTKGKEKITVNSSTSNDWNPSRSYTEHVDFNRDGIIDRADLEQTLSPIAPSMLTEKRLDEVMTSADQNQDGLIQRQKVERFHNHTSGCITGRCCKPHWQGTCECVAEYNGGCKMDTDSNDGRQTGQWKDCAPELCTNAAEQTAQKAYNAVGGALSKLSKKVSAKISSTKT